MIVAILGGGQLGRMLALAGIPLGLRFRFLDPDPDCPSGSLGELISARYDDEAALARLVKGAAVVTYEFENVPASTAAWLESHAPVHPSSRALAIAQDRVEEKNLFASLGIGTAPFERVDTRADLERAVRTLGLPAVLKTRRMGYDGKGQRVIRAAEEVEGAWRDLGWRSSDRADLVLEGFVPFAREVSVIGARGPSGEMVHYPPVQNQHAGGILARSDAPAMMPADLAAAYVAAHRKVLEAVGYVGVLAVEFFEMADGRIIANEMAPRVHNSGHWTIEGAETSQFENHLRAVIGLPLGVGTSRGASVMFNIIGRVPDVAALLKVSGAHMHLYGKGERPGRKLGHVTVCDSSQDRLSDAAGCVERLLKGA